MMKKLFSQYYGSILLIGLFVPILFLIQIWYINLQFLGWFLLAGYFFAVSFFWQIILSKVFRFRRNNFFTYILSFLVGLFIWSSLSSVFIIFFKLNVAAIVFVSILTSLSSYLLALFVRPKQKRIAKNNSGFSLSKYVIFSKHYALLALYLFFWGASAYYLYGSATYEMISTPWEAISHNFIYFFLVASLLLVSLILSRFKTKIVLSCIILHSVLLHSYLPLAHFLPFGSDIWRLIGIEQRIISGKIISPELVPPVEFRQVFGLAIPKVFTSLSQFAYGSLWGVSVNISWISSISLLSLNKWLLPILWGVAVPVIFFQIGLVLFQSLKKSLWLSFFSMMPFTFQAVGSLTLPVSFGYLIFFLVFLLWLVYLRGQTFWQRVILFGLVGLMLFGYPLVALTMIFLIVSVELWQKFDLIKSKVLQHSTKAALVLNLFVIVPVLELLFDYKQISGSVKEDLVLSEIIPMIGRIFTGWDYSQQVLERNIRVGNIFFNHTSKDTLISTFVTDFRWQIFVGMIIIWILFTIGFYLLAKSKDLTKKALLFLSIFSLSGYIVGWFFLGGNRILSARMNAMVAFSVILVMFFGLWFIFEKLSNQVELTTIKIITFLFLAFFSYFTVSSYLSGPDITAPNKEKFEVANFISKQDEFRGNSCVISDTWVLLPLQGLSGATVTGGGFPIKARLAQPERKIILHWLKDKPEQRALKNARYITGANYCWIAIKDKNLSKEKKKQITSLVNSNPVKKFGYLIWREQLNQTSS